MVSERSKRNIWILWAVFWPISVIAVLAYFPPHIGHSYFDIICMGAIIAVIGISYFRVSGVDIFIIQSVAMAVFLIFGLAVEMILVQIGVIAYLLSLRLTKSYYYRYPLNTLMFLFVSVTSASFFHLIGGHNGILSTGTNPQVFQIIGYAFMCFFSNHVAFYLVSKAFFDDAAFFGKYIIWELVTTLLTLPISFTFYILYSEYGITSILMVGIPVMTLSVIFRLINRGSRQNRLLRRTSDIGRELSQTLEKEVVFSHFFKSLHHVLEVDNAYLITLDNSQMMRQIHCYNQEGEEQLIDQENYPHPDCHFYQSSFIAASQKKWDPFLHVLLPNDRHSVMTMPLRLDEDIIGVILLANKLKHGFEKQHQMIFEILTHFFSVAVKNATNYEKTKMESERDPLTNLYNYRYFSKLLQQAYSVRSKTPFSLIMLDLDHFKSINDQFGHENGNAILKQVAARLSTAVGDHGIVSRYGGEEFIILLFASTREESYQFAEELRVVLCHHPFIVDPFNSGTKHTSIKITASMGVATAPEQGEDAVTLIRNADRAMYSGAKQKGRNRVAAYTN